LLHAVLADGVEAIGLPLFKVLGAENWVLDEIIDAEDQAEIALLGVQVPYPLQYFECLGCIFLQSRERLLGQSDLEVWR